jgi:hypothetical protein
MSYDLFFFRESGQPITQSAFLKYFRGRAHYQVKDSQAWYENEDTGVYFSFDFAEKEEEKGAAGSSPAGSVSFNMNYNRPHIFGLEAEPEVTAFVKFFHVRVTDPQEDGMGEDAYRPEGFLRGWNAGNRFGCQAILAMGNAPEVHVLPASLIESSWRWNFNRERLAEKLEQDMIVGFVPGIRFIRYKGKIARIVVWSDVVVTVIPPVDLVMVNRTKSGKKGDLALISWQEALPQLRNFKKVGQPLEYYLPPFDEVPKEILEFCAKLPPIAEKLEGVRVDEILDQELIDEIRKGHKTRK